MSHNPPSSAVVALVCSFVLLSLLELSTGHPVLSASSGALKREKRSGGSCLELKISLDSMQKLTESSPEPLLELWGRAKPGHFVRFDSEWREDGVVEGEGREMEVCKGRSKAGNSEEDIFVLMDSAQLPPRVSCC